MCKMADIFGADCTSNEGGRDVVSKLTESRTTSRDRKHIPVPVSSELRSISIDRRHWEGSHIEDRERYLGRNCIQNVEYKDIGFNWKRRQKNRTTL